MVRERRASAAQACSPWLIVGLLCAGCESGGGSPRDTKPDGGGDASSADAGDAEGGHASGEGGTGGVPTIFTFPKDVVLLSFGKPNFPGAVDTDISIDTVTLDYQAAKEVGGAVITDHRVFRLLARADDAAPGDLPGGESIKFWWGRTNDDGEVVSHVCRALGPTDRYTLKSLFTPSGEVPEPDRAACSWELVRREGGATDKEEYAIRAPEPGTTGGIDGDGFFVVGVHGSASEGYRIRVDVAFGTAPRYFELYAPGAGGD